MNDTTAENLAAGVLEALCKEVVGVDGFEIAASHFAEGHTVRELAEWHGRSRSTLGRWLQRLWAALEHANAVPPAWTRQTRGRRVIRTFNSKSRDFY
ncbi:MAG: helix-turn-helix domain-containing protein [Planctomycetota bacterium]